MRDTLRCKAAIETLRNKNKIFSTILRKWQQIEEVERILKIPYDATVALQKQDCTMSDFFGHWMRCELHLKQNSFPLTNLATLLLTALEQRKRSLFSNEGLITCKGCFF